MTKDKKYIDGISKKEQIEVLEEKLKEGKKGLIFDQVKLDYWTNKVAVDGSQRNISALSQMTQAVDEMNAFTIFLEEKLKELKK